MPKHIAKGYIGIACIAIATAAVGCILIGKGDYYASKPLICALFALFVLVGSVVATKVGQKFAWRADILFLVLFVPLSLFCLIAVPPFSTPDSYEHFLRAYEIANGRFVSEIAYVSDAQSGTFQFTSGYIYNDAGLLPIDMDRATELREITATATASVDRAAQEAYAYSTQAAYSPISFAPAAVGIFIVGLFTSNTWALIYAARAFTLLFAGALLFFAIRICPRGKITMCLLALLPISVELYPTMSPDVIAIALCFGFFAYVFRAFGQKTKVNVGVLALFMLGIALVKIVYLPVCALVFLVPDESLPARPRLLRVGLFILSCAVNLAWLGIASGSLIEYNEGVDASAQIHYVLTHPLSFVLCIVRTVLADGFSWIMQMFGSNLNWFDATPPTILPFTMLLLFVIGEARSVSPKEADEPVPRKAYAIIAGIAICVVLLIFASLYVQWTPVGAELIGGVQGRYFIPILPLLLFPFLLRERPSGPATYVAWFCLTALIFTAPLEAAL